MTTTQGRADLVTACRAGATGAYHQHQFVALGHGGVRVAIYEDRANACASLPVSSGELHPGTFEPMRFASVADAFAQLLPGYAVPAVECNAEAEPPAPVTLSLPGAFADWLEGTGAGQGTDTGDGARLGEIYAAGLWKRRSLLLTFCAGDAEALAYLAELAHLAAEDFTDDPALSRSACTAGERVRAARAELAGR